MKILLLSIVLGLALIPARADSVVNVVADNIQYSFSGTETVNIEMQLDLTNLSVLSYSATLTPDNVAGGLLPASTTPVALALGPLCNPRDCICPGGICSIFPASTQALFNFYGDGWVVELGDDDYTYAYFPGLQFPAIGTYSYRLESDEYTGVFEYGQPTGGDAITVTDSPDPMSEPSIAIMLLAGFVGIGVFRRLRGFTLLPS